MSIQPVNKLVKLVGRAFYDDITEGDNQHKTGRSDNRGIGVVVLDTLTRRQWVSEEDLAKDLKLNSKQLCPTLEFLEKENLVTRDQDAKKELKSSETRDSDGPSGMSREAAPITGNEENYRVNDLIVEADAAAAAEDEDDIDLEEG
ncbi:PREDICTED: general mRNAion factor IIE [Prunus dulcis]|uniref:PREDICTED: general mRNAion factor IIE n=1 Tax=Prunus dulcis TaxID=3755 RepID=A0A5E4GAN0_PRUDU|nr:PREDICTED: general mRNAion factor IIE [Prunus dulcis]